MIVQYSIYYAVTHIIRNPHSQFRHAYLNYVLVHEETCTYSLLREISLNFFREYYSGTQSKEHKAFFSLFSESSFLISTEVGTRMKWNRVAIKSVSEVGRSCRQAKMIWQANWNMCSMFSTPVLWKKWLCHLIELQSKRCTRTVYSSVTKIEANVNGKTNKQIKSNDTALILVPEKPVT